MKVTLVALAATAVLAGGVSAVQATETQAVPQPRFMRVPCAQEDGRNCYWDAGSQGNGAGHSFFSIPVPSVMPGAPRTGTPCDYVRYWDRDYGRRHDYIAC